MERELLERLSALLRESAGDLAAVGSERALHDVLVARLRGLLPGVEARRRVEAPGLPPVEVDLLDAGSGVAIEVKLRPQRFYEGLQQVLVLRDLYGLRPVLVQVYERVDERVLGALRVVARRYSVPVIVVDAGRGEAVWLGESS